MNVSELPLDGIRVADLTRAWAGPYAAQLLADWGAEVIRVETCQILSRNYFGPKRNYSGIKGRLSTAPPNRDPNPRFWNRNPVVNAHARNKLSMTADLRRPEGLDIFKRLIKVSDVFIENNGPGTVEKLGISYEVLKEIKNDLIMVRMPGFGLSGPYSGYRTFGSQLDNFCGMACLMGYRDSDPSTISGTVFADATGGGNAALAIMMALDYRHRTGKGQFIEVAQIESLMPQFGEYIMDWTLNQHIQPNPGNRHPSASQGCYRCKGEDRWVNITINSDEEWEGFRRALGNPLWCQDERFSTVVSRYQHHDELDKLIEGWTTRYDNYEVMHILQGEGVPAGPVMDERDVFSDPQVEEREFLQEMTQAECGTHRYAGLSWKMSKTPNQLRLPPCLLGEHNEYVYKQVIGVSDEEYDELEKEGHIGMDFTPDAKYG